MIGSFIERYNAKVCMGSGGGGGGGGGMSMSTAVGLMSISKTTASNKGSACVALAAGTAAMTGFAAGIPTKSLKTSVVKGVVTTTAAGMAMSYDAFCR
jgi:hypothetical protein